MSEKNNLAKIGERGQITIPAEIRKLLEASPGEYVAFEVNKTGEIKIRKVEVEIQIKEVKKK